MSVTFKHHKHLYESIDPTDKIIWTSVTKFISLFKEPFDAVKISEKSSKNKKSKWYGVSPQMIQNIWKMESERADQAGTWYHNQREDDISSLDTLERDGRALPIIKPIINGDIKFAPVQQLTEGIYPEHFVYLKSAGICGQADRVEVVRDVINITDYKTNKEIKTQGFKNWEGVTKKMLGPISHLDDCNLNHYTLQVSMYMHIMIKHNPNLRPGKMELQHVTFKIKELDEFGFPIAVKDAFGKPIVDKITHYTVPYLRSEVREMIKYFTDKNHEKNL